MQNIQETVDALRAEYTEVLERGIATEMNAFVLMRKSVKLAIFNIGQEASIALAIDILEGLRGIFPAVAKAGWILAGKGIDLLQGYTEGVGFIQEVGAPSAFSRNKAGKIVTRKAAAIALQKLWTDQDWDELYQGQVKIVNLENVKYNSPESLRRGIESLVKRFERQKFEPYLTMLDHEMMEKAVTTLRDLTVLLRK